MACAPGIASRSFPGRSGRSTMYLWAVANESGSMTLQANRRTLNFFVLFGPHEKSLNVLFLGGLRTQMIINGSHAQDM